MGLPLIKKDFYDSSTALNTRDSPTKLAETAASLSLNMEYGVDGAFYTRNGSSIINHDHQMAQLRNLAMFDYRKSDGTQVAVNQNGSIIYTSSDLSNPVAAVTGLNSTAIPDMEFQVTLDDEYLIWGNGVDTDLKFDGTTWTPLSIVAPANPTVAPNAGTLADDYAYLIAFVRYDVGTNTIEQISDLNVDPQFISPAGESVDITRPASTDSQVNGWVIYRAIVTSGVPGTYFQLIDVSGDPVIVPIATTTYNDDVSDAGTIEAEFDNQAAPTSAIFEEYLGSMNYVDVNSKTDLYESKPYLPWNVPEEQFEIFDGPIQCVKRIYNVLFIATDRSMWVREGRLSDGAEAKKLSSVIGVLNNRCADGLSYLYVVATNKKVYRLTPTDFANLQVRVDQPISDKIEGVFNSISNNLLDQVAVKYYTTANVAKLMISAPISSVDNSNLIVLNETQMLAVQEPVWQYINNWNVASMNMFTFSGRSNLYSGDYNGYLWKLDDPLMSGDGAEENGTVTSSGATTLTETGAGWTVDEFKGMIVRIVSGVSEGETKTIISNTDDTLTVDSAWDDNPPADSEFSIGGFDNYHFTNWKSVTGSYEALKQLWFIFANMNASGNYPISLIIQIDFNQSINDSVVLNINLQAANTIWGDFIWGDAPWGAFAVFQDRIRQFERFYAIRFGFRSQKAGQPFQCNGYSIACQDKQLFYGSAL